MTVRPPGRLGGDASGPPAGRPAGPRSRGTRVARAAFLVLVVAALVWVLAKDGGHMLDAVRDANPVTLALAVLAAVVGQVALWLSWRSVWDATTGVRLAGRPSAAVYYGGQLGKYVPGGVWTVLGHAQLAAAHAVPRTRAAVASAASLVVLVATGGALGSLALVGSAGTSGLVIAVVAIAVVGCLVLLVPGVLGRATARLAHLAGRSAVAAPLTGRAVLGASAWLGLWWVAAGTHLWLLLGAVADVPAERLPRVVAALAFAWVAGVVVIVAPAGAGAREAALVLLLAGVASQSAVLGAVLVSRAVFIATDVAAALLSGVLARRAAAGPLGDGAASGT